MIQVIGNDGSKIYYKCDCGIKGFCMIKPQEQDAAIVVDVRCPACGQVERMVLLQSSSEENREKLLKNLNEADLSWSSILENRVLEE